MTENKLKETLFQAYKSNLSNKYKVAYGTIAQLPFFLEQRYPHLQIDSFQFIKQFMRTFEDIVSSPILVFKAFDRQLNLFKSIQVQCLDTFDEIYTYQGLQKELQYLRDKVTKFMLNDSILKIYDYCQLNIDDNPSYPLYFIIESELIYKTLEECKDEENINMNNNNIEKCITQSEFYLSSKFKQCIKLSEEEIFVIKNSDNTYSLKLNPLSHRILEDQHLAPRIYQLSNNQDEEDVQEQSNDLHPYSLDQRNSISGEGDEEQSYDSIMRESQEDDEDLNDYSNNNLQLELGDDEDECQFSSSNEEQIDDDCNQHLNNGIRQQGQGEEVIQFKQQEQQYIAKQDFVSTLIDRFPLLIEYHNNTQIFEIISDHPKYSDFYLFDYDEATFTFKIKHEEKNYFMKCEKYSYLIEAENNLKKYEQLKIVWDSVFVPLLDCEIIPLDDFTYLVFVEEDWTIKSTYPRNKDYDEHLPLWLIDQDMRLKSLNLNEINIYNSDVYLLSEFDNFEENYDKRGYENRPFYLSNPLFGNERIEKLNLLRNYLYYVRSFVDRLNHRIQYESIQYERLERIQNQIQQYFNEKVNLKKQNSQKNFQDFSDLKTFVEKSNQMLLLQKIVPEQLLFLNKNLKITILIDNQFNISYNKLQYLLNFKGLSIHISQGQLSYVLEIFKNPVSLSKLSLSSLDLSHLNGNEVFDFRKFDYIFSNLKSLSIIIDNNIFLSCSNISFSNMSQLEKITLQFKGDYMQDYISNYHDNEECVEKNSERIQNLLSLLENKNLKSININQRDMFYFNHCSSLKDSMVKRNKKGIDENSLQQLSQFFQQISINKNTSSEQQKEEIASNNNLSKNMYMEIESLSSSEQYDRENSYQSYSFSEEQGYQDERGEEENNLDHIRDNLIRQIRKSIQKFDQLNYYILCQEVNKKSVLQIRFEESANKYLQFNLTFHAENSRIELDIQTNHLQRFSSCCCNIGLDHQNLYDLVQFWLETEQQIEIMKTLFGYNKVGHCKHIDEINFLKNLYSNHTENLTKFKLDLQPCEFIEEQIATMPDFYGLSNFTKLYHLSLTIQNEKFWTYSSLKPKHLLHNNRSISIIKFCVYKYAGYLLWEKHKLNPYYKIPRLVSVQIE